MSSQAVSISENFAFKNLTNCYSVQKTLRFSLIPRGKTAEHIRNWEFLEKDKQRYQDSKIVQGFIDDLCREFIENALENVNIDNWEELEELEKKESSRNEKTKARKPWRDELATQFNEQNKNLFSDIKKGKSGFIQKALPAWMRDQGQYSEDDIEIVNSFNKFGGYFNTFMKNRKNMFAVEGEATSVFTRTVDDNFMRFLNNKKKLKTVESSGISLLELEAFDNDLLGANSYNSFISPNGINIYNKRIGKINSQLNEKKQNGLINKKIKLDVLYKQILCEGESSFRIEKIENDGELSSALDLVYKLWFKGEKTEDEEIPSIVDSAREAVGLIESGYADIKIEPKKVGDLSKVLFDNRNSLFVDEGKEEEKKKTVGLFQLKEDYNSSSDKNEDIPSIVTKLSNKLDDLKIEIDKRRSVVEDIVGEYSDSEGKELIKDDGKIGEIKDFFDELKKYESIVRVFENKTDNVAGIDFYIELDSILKKLKEFDKLYDQVRNYLTQKPYSTEKISLTFDIPTLCNGWDKNKEKDNLALIFRKEGEYYLGIMQKGSFVEFENFKCHNSDFEKLEYKLVPDAIKMLPKVFFAKDRKPRIAKDILDIRRKQSFKTDPSALSQYIEFYKDNLSTHEWNEWFNFEFKGTSDYSDFRDFCQDVNRQGFLMKFSKIANDEVDRLVEEGKLLLFKIYNKDYSDYASGSKNLHTLYWEELFGEGNLNGGYPIKLNGGSSLFYREKSIKQPIIHKEGELLINKTYEGNGVWKSIPDDVYAKAQEIVKASSTIEEVKKEISKLHEDGDKFVVKKCKHDIVKDKRYTQDHFQFHVPITLNRCPESKDINQSVLEIIKKRDDITFLGIDRGERHLLYLTLIDSKGNIKFQRTMNLVPCKRGDDIIEIDYRSKLDNKVKVRDEARKSWKQIGNIKDLKQGYLSQVVHEIAKIVVENNAVIVMEDLSSGFKRGRQKFEKQVYQKFEKQLIDKLSYLSFKPETGIEPYDPGGIANGLQLCRPVEKLSDMKGQVGIIFYVRPWNTSHVDPTTGFMNLFQFGKIKSGKKWKEFFGCFDSVCYDIEQACFCFDFHYSKFGSIEDSKNHWRVYTQGERLWNHKNSQRKFESQKIEVTNEIKQLFDDYGIDFMDGQDLLDDIQTLEAYDLMKLGWLFKTICNLRNSDSGTDIDYILSPVMNSDGEFFDSREAKDGKPENADANGAYHIALKGLQLATEGLEQGKGDKLSIKPLKNIDWNRWIQKFHEREVS